MAKAIRFDSNEHEEQAALFRWIALHKTRYPALAMAFAIPNGGKRDEATGARLRDEGVQRGVPDVCIAYPSSGWHGLFIELKWGKNTATPEQLEWLARLKEQGYFVYVAYGWQDAVQVISDYLGIESE